MIDDAGFTPLIETISFMFFHSFDGRLKDLFDCAVYLIKAGASINQKDNFGRTAIMYVIYAQEYTEQLISVLVQYGADINARDSDGHTALWYAELHKNEKCIKLLKNAGGKL